MIVLVFGLPGTGKTFISKKIAEETRAVHLNTDMIREKLDFTEHYDEKTKQQVYNELIKHVKRELKKGLDVIVDGTFHLENRRKQLSKIAKETGNEIYFIEMNAKEETVKKRLKKNRKHSEADFEVYLQVKDEFEKPKEKRLELWSDEEESQQLLEKVKEYIHG